MKVSVCITHYNRIDLLHRAISSVILQGESIGEIIVVDDCSPKDVQSEMLSRFGHIELLELIFLNNNQGPQVARNKGIAEAKYEMIALMDCDDVWLEGKISSQLDFMQSHNLDVCSCGFVIDGEADLKAEKFIPDYEGDAIKYICAGGHMQTSTLLLRAEVAKKMKFDVTLRKFQDWDFIFRISSEKYKIGYLSERLVDYSKKATDQMTKSYDPDYAKKFIIESLMLVGRQNATNFFIRRLSAMYFNKGMYYSAALSFVEPIYRFRCFMPTAMIGSLIRFLYYKLGL